MIHKRIFSRSYDHLKLQTKDRDKKSESGNSIKKNIKEKDAVDNVFECNSESPPEKSSVSSSPSLTLFIKEDFDQDVYLNMIQNNCSVGDRLRYLCKHGNVALLDELLAEESSKAKGKFDLNCQYLDRNNNFCTLLHTSARYDQLECAQLLVEKYRMHVDCKDRNHATPLFYAAANGSMVAATYLVSLGASVNIRDNFENTPLLLAMRYEAQKEADVDDGIDIELTQVLLGFDMCRMLLMSKADIHLKIGKGNSLLHVACECGDDRMVRFLLENGASIHRTNRSNETPLFPSLPHPFIIQILCSQVKQDHSSIHAFYRTVQIRNTNGRTVLHRCSADGYLDSMKIILKTLLSTLEQASEGERQEIKNMLSTALNDPCVKRGWTPLHYAVNGQQIATVQFLSQIKDVNVNIGDRTTQSTPLHLAISMKHEKLINILVETGNADTNARNLNKISCKQLAKSQDISLKRSKKDIKKIDLSLQVPDFRPVLNEIASRCHSPTD